MSSIQPTLDKAGSTGSTSRTGRAGHASHAGNRIKLSKGDLLVEIAAYIITALLTLICFYPFWYAFLTSISQSASLSAVGASLLFPSNPTLKIYRQIFKDGEIFRGMFVSGIRVLVSSIAVTVCSSTFAFLMTRQNMPFRKIIYRYAIVTMYVGGGLVPWYLVMRAYGLYNNFFVYVVPGLVNMFFVILIKTYMESLPAEMEEAARIDGAGAIKTLFSVILPLCMPILATCALFTAVGAWNTFMDNYMLVPDPNLQTVQIMLYRFVLKANDIANQMKSAAASGGMTSAMAKLLITPEAVRTATTIISIIPIMCIYPFLQKYFAKGILLGAVKG